jgi:hypothetical protein
VGGCATVPPGRAPAERESVPERRAEEPTGILGPQKQRRLLEAKAKRYAGYIERHVIGRASTDIAYIKRKHYLEGGTVLGVHHFHVQYRDRGALASPPLAAVGRHPGGWHHLHYHGLENITRARSTWRASLRQSATGDLKRWLAATLSAQFQYERFFYGDGGRPRPKAKPVDPGVLKSYAREQWKHTATPGRRPTDGQYHVILDRLRLLAGADQPGYSDAATRLMAARSLVAKRGHGLVRPVAARFTRGFFHPATVYVVHNAWGCSPRKAAGGLSFRVEILDEGRPAAATGSR